MAADHDVAAAQSTYGVCLEHGTGVGIDLTRAAEYYRMAADQNFAMGQFRYGFCLRHGRGVPLDLCSAARFWKLAADQDLPHAQFSYGFCFLEGRGFRIDRSESAKYLRLAAGLSKKVDGIATSRIRESPIDFPLNELIVQALYSRGVREGLSGMLNELGQYLEVGEYMRKDLALAARCYSEAASESSEAQVNYGFCLEHGLGVERDVSKSFEFYEKSMVGNNAAGSGHYALSLHFGTGVWEDLEYAVDHYESVDQRQPGFLRSNSSRCFRGLNRKRPISSRGSGQFEVPALILHYRVEPICAPSAETLGSGADGRVTRERDRKRGNETIAVKWIAGRCDYREFLREVENLITVRHPCVIEILGWSSSSGTFELQMKWAENGDLSQYLGRNYPPTALSVIVCGIVLGMRYVHSRGIVHRDLKPSNILLDENWHALICDFGRSKFGSAEGLSTPFRGTFEYSAPEQFHTVPYNEKVDVYSFGLVLYALISGASPFREGRPRVLPPAPEGSGPLMEKFIPWCCREDPSDRPSFGDIFAEFERCKFELFPKANSIEIAKYVREVLDVEERRTAWRR
jgi:TPR repeat protein